MEDSTSQFQNLLQSNQGRPIDQWDRIEIPEINSCVCGQLIFNKHVKISGEKKFSTNSSGPFWYIYTMEYYSAIKKNTFESVLMRWMKLEPIMQSEVSQTYIPAVINTVT